SDEIAAQANNAARQIGELMRQGNREEAEEIKLKTSKFKEQIKSFSDQLNKLENEFYSLLVTFPNLPHESVPAGLTAEDNEVVLQHGETPEFQQEALPHWELATKYDIIDFETGTKIS